MPRIDNLFKNGTVIGVAIGLGAVAIAAALVPALPAAIARAGRPAARGAIKSGLLLMERGREVLAEASEELDDLLAEVRAELQQGHSTHNSYSDQADAAFKTYEE